MSDIERAALRPPRAEEHPALAALCLRSKAIWGYDAAFLERCAPVLVVSPELAASGLVRVAEYKGSVAGVVQVSIEGEDAELDLLFVEPRLQGAGVGRVLFDWALSAARERGAARLMILADPGAKSFYERLGAEHVGDAPSDAIPDRVLPRLRVVLV